ncbi:MAG: hypothetical protein QXS20_03745 [Candidatus Thorarchaeota archaeon]
MVSPARYGLIIFTMIMLLPTAIGIVVVAGPTVPAQSAPDVDVGVVGGQQAPAVMSALALDSSAFNIQEYDTTALALAASGIDVLIVIDTPFSPGDLAVLSSFVSSGGGLFILTGPRMTADGTGFQEIGVTANNSLAESEMGKEIVTRVMSPTDPLVTFDWASAPTVQRMTVLPVSVGTVVILAEDRGFGMGGHPILTRTTLGTGTILVYTPWLTLNSSAEEPQTNREIVIWPYFNYFIYSASLHLAGEEPYTYAEWAYSPVPHRQEQIVIGSLVAVLAVTTVSAFIKVRRHSRAHTEALTNIRQAGLLVQVKEKIDDWEEIGMHRQLGGFLIQLFITLIIVIPRVVLSVMIYPRYIMPFPQAAGWYSFSVNLFIGLWTIFDMGTMVALAKYFAEYRVDQPDEAIKYAQIFVWFQSLTGVVQITLVAFMGSIFFPHTYLAHLSYIFIAHSLFQFPGITLLFAQVFRGMNRIDMQQITDILYYAVFNIVGPYTMIVVFRWWGAQNPVFGEAMGAAIGQAVGAYLTEWMTFGVSLILFRRLGLRPSTLFRVDFGADQFKRALKFGAKWTVGAATVPLVWFYQMVLVSTNLLNWSALQGQYQLAWDLAIMVSVVGLFMEGMLGGISEAYSHKKMELTKLYTAQGLKYGAFFVFWLISVLAAVGPRAILGAAGPQWAYAAHLLWFFLLFQLMGFWSWLGDWMFAGADRTGLAALVWVLEQAIRAVAMTLFVIYEPVVLGVYLGGMPGIIVGYCIGLFVKDIAAWVIIRRTISSPKLYIWQSYVGPAIAAVGNFIVLELFSQMVWQNDLITSAFIFFVGTLPSLYLFSFLSGISGTWDDRTMKEFKRAAGMVRIRGIGWLARRFYGSVALGAAISPLHDRFPIDIYDSAMAEADELTRQKKQLII